MSTLEVRLLVAPRLDYIEELLTGVRVLVMGGSSSEVMEASRRKAEVVTWVHPSAEQHPPPMRHGHPRLVDHVADRTATGLHPESYDVVICSDLTFQEEDIRAQLAEIRRLLHPDGFLYLTLPLVPPGSDGVDLTMVRSELRRFFPNVEMLTQQVFTGVMVGPDARSLPTWRQAAGNVTTLTITLCSRLLIVLEEQMLQLHPMESAESASGSEVTPDAQELEYLREQAHLVEHLQEKVYRLEKERPHPTELEQLRSEVRALRTRAELGDKLALELEDTRQTLAQAEQRWRQSQLQGGEEGEEVDTLRTRQDTTPGEVEELRRELQTRDSYIQEQAREIQLLQQALHAQVAETLPGEGQHVPDEIWSPPADIDRPPPAEGGGVLWQEMLTDMETESQGWETPQESPSDTPPPNEVVDEWESGPTPLGYPREGDEHLDSLEEASASHLPPLPDVSPLDEGEDREREEDVDMSEVFTISAFWNEVDRAAPNPEKPPEPPQEGELALLESIQDDRLTHLPRVTRSDRE